MTTAWTLADGRAVAITSAAPPPGDDDVVIEIEAAELSLDELTTSDGEVPGHAAVGRVVAAGAHGAALLGRRVAIGPLDPCHECELCRRGAVALCPRARRRGQGARGTLARHVTAAARGAIALDDGLDVPGPEAAALGGAAALAYTLYARASVAPREPVVVLGADAITRLLVEILCAKGVQPTVLVDDDPGEAGWAGWLAERGAVVARAPRGAALGTAREALTAALATLAVAGKPWRLVIADPAAVRRASELAGPRATLTALAHGPATLDPGVLAREVQVTGVAGPHPSLLVEVAAMVVKRELDLSAAVAVRRRAALPGAAPGRRVVVVTIDP